MSRETEKHQLTHLMIREEPIGGTSFSQKDQDVQGVMFLDGHFETITDSDIHKFLPYLLVTESAGHAHLPHEHHGVWLLGQVRSLHRIGDVSIPTPF